MSEENTKNPSQKFMLITIVVATVISSSFGFLAGTLASRINNTGRTSIGDVLSKDITVIEEESAVIEAAAKADKSVVSIVITKDVPLFRERRLNPFEDDIFDFFNNNREQIGTEERQVGAGTGFIISQDGTVITNRHVVDDEEASYTVILNDGKEYQANVLERDTLLDIAIMKIDSNDTFVPLELGSSENIKVGQSVIAVGNSLGQFSNTVSTGIVSGLSRDITAGNQSGTSTELLTDVIQTDASINFGNSGGPLLDITGKVIGVNVAVAQDAENIGFAIPINTVKDLLKRYESTGSIERPVLGIRYASVSEQILLDRGISNFDKDYGVIIVRGTGSNGAAILADSPAAKAGLKEDDIILEIDGIQISEQNPLDRIIKEKFKGDTITLKVWRDGTELDIQATL